MRLSSHIGPLAIQLGFLVIGAGLAWPQSACDLNNDGTVNVADVQLATNMYLGQFACTASVNGPGVCDSVVIQRVTDAALGGPCVTGTRSTSHSVTLSWMASTSANVIGYNIYRATTPRGPYTKLNSSRITGVGYTDTAVEANRTYYYVATAIDGSNNESGYSNEAQAIMPSS